MTFTVQYPLFIVGTTDPDGVALIDFGTKGGLRKRFIRFASNPMAALILCVGGHFSWSQR